MILISHRGNITGPNPDQENKPQYISATLEQGYDVEIDVWWHDKGFYLGHDAPEYDAKYELLMNPKVWCHAKNIKAFYELLKIRAVCFFHETDQVTLTSNGFIWTYPGMELTPNSICVMPENAEYKDINCSGICSDFIKKYDINK